MKTFWTILLLSASCFAQGILAPIFQRPPAGGGSNTWTLVNHGFTTGAGTAFSCSTGCTQSFGWTATAGNTLVAIFFGGTNPLNVKQTNLTSGWTHPGGDSAGVCNDTTLGTVDCAYKAVAAGAESSIAWDFAGGSCFHCFLWVGEFHPSGTGAYDTSNARDTGGSFSTTPAGPALTITGSSDAIIQAAKSGNNVCTAVGTGYSTPDTNNDGSTYASVAYALNSSTGTSQTWTCGNGQWLLNAVAFK